MTPIALQIVAAAVRTFVYDPQLLILLGLVAVAGTYHFIAFRKGKRP